MQDHCFLDDPVCTTNCKCNLTLTLVFPDIVYLYVNMEKRPSLTSLLCAIKGMEGYNLFFSISQCLTGVCKHLEQNLFSTLLQVNQCMKNIERANKLRTLSLVMEQTSYPVL